MRVDPGEQRLDIRKLPLKVSANDATASPSA